MIVHEGIEMKYWSLIVGAILLASCGTPDVLNNDGPIYSARHEQNKEALMDCFHREVSRTYTALYRNASASEKRAIGGRTIKVGDSNIAMLRWKYIYAQTMIWDVRFNALMNNLTNVEIVASPGIIQGRKANASPAIEHLAKCTAA